MKIPNFKNWSINKQKCIATCGLLLLSTQILNLPLLEAFQTASQAKIVNGKVAESVVLADDKGVIFLELLKDQRVAHTEDQSVYVGEILPPLISESPVIAPQARMREVLTLEIITSDNKEITFVDRYAMMKEKERLRLSLLEDQQARETGMLLLTRIFTSDEVGDPTLWRLADPTNKERQGRWRRIGGSLENANEPDIQIFSATIFESGVYTIWDEDPPPSSEPYWTDPQVVEPALPSPIESVSPRPAQPIVEAVPSEEVIDTDFYNSAGSPETPVAEIPAVDPNFSFESGVTSPILPPVIDIEIPAVEPLPLPTTSTNTDGTNPLQEALNAASLQETGNENKFSNEFLSSVDAGTEFINVAPSNPNARQLPVAGQSRTWNFPWAFAILLLTIGSSVWVVLRQRV